MDWTEVTVTVDAAEIDRASDIAQMVVPYGIYIEDYSHLEEEAKEIAHIDLIDEELLKKGPHQGDGACLHQPGGKPGRGHCVFERTV
jgi:[LSU ribosomal protein L11P]-lysine N-methyltransferase (EC 2.1.1.-)